MMSWLLDRLFLAPRGFGGGNGGMSAAGCYGMVDCLEADGVSQINIDLPNGPDYLTTSFIRNNDDQTLQHSKLERFEKDFDDPRNLG